LAGLTKIQNSIDQRKDVLERELNASLSVNARKDRELQKLQTQVSNLQSEKEDLLKQLPLFYYKTSPHTKQL
jgi:septation ring formation regulator EzrA